jgi:hypothetical protein
VSWYISRTHACIHLHASPLHVRLHCTACTQLPYFVLHYLCGLPYETHSLTSCPPECYGSTRYFPSLLPCVVSRSLLPHVPSWVLTIHPYTPSAHLLPSTECLCHCPPVPFDYSCTTPTALSSSTASPTVLLHTHTGHVVSSDEFSTPFAPLTTPCYYIITWLLLVVVGSWWLVVGGWWFVVGGGCLFVCVVTWCLFSSVPLCFPLCICVVFVCIVLHTLLVYLHSCLSPLL